MRIASVKGKTMEAWMLPQPSEPNTPKEPQQGEVFQDRLIFCLGIVFLMWTVKMVEIFTPLNFAHFGVLPRTLSGLVGVLTMPFLHADLGHLSSNTLPTFLLLLATVNFYPKVSGRVILLVVILSGGLVWCFARPSYHIGASAMIYGLAAFLFFSGIFRRDTKSIAVALLVAFLYGGLVWGILPLYRGVSWEGHLFGAVAGTVLAYRYRQVDRAPEPDWDEDEASDLPWRKTFPSTHSDYD